MEIWSESSDIENGQVDEDEQWKRTFDIKLLNAKSPLPSTCCIFKVPEVLRRQNKQAYEPDIVSIGPFHRGAGEKIKLVGNVKEWYLKCLLSRTKTITLDSLIESIKGLGLEKQARGCYQPCFHLDQNHFIEMLILDGCFLIELFQKAHSKGKQDSDDPIFHVSCMLEYLYHDLLLLENQLPWFVLEFFYNLIEPNSPKSLSDVVIDFFKDAMADPKFFRDPNPKSPGKILPNPKSPGKILHILDLIRTALIENHFQSSPEPSKSNHLPQRIPCATALSEAGVKFKKGSQGCILDIAFKDGVFTIPPLAIDERTGPLFRNLMAFEQCYHSHEHKITSYAVLMDNLIDTNKDVDFLCEKEIVANWLSADDASKFFNDLYNDTTVIDFFYKKLCDDVNKYHKKPWNKYREKLKRDYFGTPWSTISFVAASVLLVLTVLQTIYTIHPYYYSRGS